MTREELSSLTDDELRAAAKKMKASAIMHAMLIGFMVGVVVYSVARNTVGLVTLIPLFLIYKLSRSPEHDKALRELLSERGLG